LVARVAGTPAARKAWIALRGPFFLAYVAIFTIGLLMDTDTVRMLVWRTCLVLTGAALMAGSAASFVVVGRPSASRHWHCLELLEVTGLRALVAIQATFVVVGIISPITDPRTVLTHALLGLFALGILSNLAWNRGAQRGG
jgi:hypothetical protein